MSISRITTGRVRKWITVSMIIVLVASLIVWSLDRRTVPRRIRIATGADRGLYHQVGSSIKESLEKRIVSSVEVLETLGSRDNFDRLRAGDAELAIVQGGSVPLEDVCVITPLFPEYVFVIARKDAKIQHVWELAGRRVSLGARGSGNRASALKVLRHFGVDESEILGDSEVPFTDLVHDESIEVAIVTAGIEHPLLRDLLATNRFTIVPIRSARAMELVHPFVLNVEVPEGLFGEHPSLPDKPIPTIAATAYLVCENGAPYDLVQAALESIHEESLRLKLLDYLDKVTDIKLRALQEFTEEELRDNRAFSILLDQCSGLISKIQLQLVLAQSGSNDAGSVKKEEVTP